MAEFGEIICNGGKFRYTGEISKLQRELSESGSSQTKMQKLLKKGIHLLTDLPQFYRNNSVQVKCDVLGSIFPEKFIADEK